MRAHNGSNLLTAYVGVAVRSGNPGTQENNINSSFTDLAIEYDKHELNLGRCPGPTRTLIVHQWRLLTRILSDTAARERYSVVPFFGFGPRTKRW